MALIKTGQINFRDDDGALWLAESFQNHDTGEVTTQQMLLEAAPAPLPEEQGAS
jgi:hypothetical protein